MTGGKGSHSEASPLTNRWSKSRPQAQKLARRAAGCAQFTEPLGGTPPPLYPLQLLPLKHQNRLQNYCIAAR